jgi:branched-chain amino acid transport system permease protein
MSAAAPSAPAKARRRLPAMPQFGPNASRIAGAVALVVAILFPLFYDPLSGFLDATTTALAYVVMALGLNIVVGFAGLLDLGYVAFFAIGAYTMGWLGSGFYSTVNHGKGIHVLVSTFA